jgi:hypothetical protein
MKLDSCKIWRHIVVSLAALLVSGAASANVFFHEWQPGAQLFSELELKPCEELWTKNLAYLVEGWQTLLRENAPGGRRAGRVAPGIVEAANKELERSRGMSGLEYGRQSSSGVTTSDLGTIRENLKSTGKDLAVLQSGSDDRIGEHFHVQLSTKQIDERVTYALTWRCTYNVRLAQLTNKATSTPGAKGGAVSFASKQDPFPKVGGGGPNAPAPAPLPGNGSPGLGVGIISAPLPKLSSAQIAACSEEIRRTQLASQGWSGDVNQVAARLGQFQKDMFEGRCVGHPEAQAYLAGANKMLADGNATDSGGGSTGLSRPVINPDNGNTTVGRPIQNNVGAGQPQQQVTNHGQGGGSTTHLDPRTGKPCVQQIEGPPQTSERYHLLHFTNTCERSFSIELVSANGKVLRSNGIGTPSKGKPGTSHLSCERSVDCTGSGWRVRP